MTCTLGLSVVPPADANLEAVLAQAIDACRVGRQRGGNQAYTTARADTDQRVQSYDKVWVKHIKAALMENRFRLVQQPVASLQGRRSEHVRRAGAHDRHAGQGGAARRNSWPPPSATIF